MSSRLYFHGPLLLGTDVFCSRLVSGTFCAKINFLKSFVFSWMKLLVISKCLDVCRIVFGVRVWKIEAEIWEIEVSKFRATLLTLASLKTYL